MATDWKLAFDAALREDDPAIVPASCNHARRLINDRTLAIGAEMKDLEEALRRLFVHQMQKCGHPSSRG